jgi:hypothetical protein
MDITTIIIIIIVLLVIFQLYAINKTLKYALSFLASLDGELFHLAQEQNPTYGICSNCGRRATVRHVFPKDQKEGPKKPDMFYCHRCWWLSSTVMAGDEKKYYKDRQTQEDIIAATIGPATP